tara:strand:- start:1281 stop:2327 length:1047 start_codon:yes stop_codon:yes gene_type:complete
MAVRKPLYNFGGALREMSTAQINAVKDRVVYLHGDASYRSSNLVVDGVGTGIRRMIDSRDIAGNATSDANRFSDNNTFISNNPAIDAGATTTYDKISASISSPSDPGDASNIAYPLYYDGNGVLRSMSQTDMYDTFINDGIDLIVDNSASRDGTYTVYTDTSGLSGATLISSTPIFTDQQFNEAVHSNSLSEDSGGGAQNQNILPLQDVGGTSVRDQPVTIQNYYLWRTDQGSISSITVPVRFTSNNQIKTYSGNEFNILLGNLLAYSAASRSPYRIAYDIEGVGTDAFTITAAANTPQARGSSITDTTLHSQVRINDQDGQNAYRSQNLPAGVSETETTYTLKIYRY